MESRHRHQLKWEQFMPLLFVLLMVALAQGQTRSRRPTRPAKISTRGAVSPAADRFAAVWEPINYPDDIDIHDIFFVTPEEGWAAAKGKGWVLLHTSDGGRQWEPQLGDPQGTAPEFSSLQFIDQRHGWAVQNRDKVLRTSDGKNWEEAGALPKFHPFSALTFTSLQSGVFIGGYPNTYSIFVTRDGGRNWKDVFQCKTRLRVEGLVRNEGCSLFAVHFPTPKIGYAVGGAYNGGFNVIAKTEDGGLSWRLIFSTTEIQTGSSVFFLNANTGFMETRDGKLYTTTDGGRTWRGLVATLDSHAGVRFADPEVAWTCWRQQCAYSTDGGQHWNTREFKFPAYIDAFTVPRRDSVYVAGNHGMIYRYRVLPRQQVTGNMVPAPEIPGYGSLNPALQRIRVRIKALEQKLAAAGAPVADAASSSADADASSDTADTAAMPATGDTTAAGGDSGFSQDTASPATFDQSTAMPDFPASSAMQDCCAAQIQGLQSDLMTFNQQAPSFAGRFRNLNLLVIGLNMFSDLVNRAHGMRDSFLALKKAPNLQAAAAALQDLSAKLDGASQAVSSGFANLSAGGPADAFAGSAAGATGNTFSGDPIPADSTSQDNASNAGSTTPGTDNSGLSSQTTGAAKAQEKKQEDSVKDKLKKKFKRFSFPR